MSTLFLATDQIALADTLADFLDAEARQGDFFSPATIVVPNRYLGQWLRLWLARTRGIAINLRFLYLEAALWELLREQDPRNHPQPLELVDQEGYRLMVLSLLLEDALAPELAPLRYYLRSSGVEAGRSAWRRAWHLADRLARLVRDYEYHRQDTLIQKWLRGELGYPHFGEARVRLEKSQREVFHQITRLPDGKRDRLGQADGKLYKTLPQYAMEIMELRNGDCGLRIAERKKVVHLFGITQISYLHLHTLRWLGERYDLRLYHYNPLVGQMPPLTNTPPTGKIFQELAQRFREPGDTGNALLRSWGRAAAESLWLLADLVNGPFAVEVLSPGGLTGAHLAGELARRVRHPVHGGQARRLNENVLGRLQKLLLNSGSANPQAAQQDTSLQIVACPGIYREVETVYNSILYNLQNTPDLMQTDIAVLVTDMARYRPVLQAVFEREPQRIRYNLGDFAAAGMSHFGQALVGFLDLALESFTRSRVFEALLNPCVLARLNVDRTQAASWLAWAEKLGIYHGWDAKDKEERGYGRSPLFGWQLALRRLRLGRLMEVSGEERDGPAPRFQGVIPFADLASSDKEQLDAFCRAVEGLLPALGRLRHFQGSGGQWAGEILKLVQRFLAVPPDRPEEGQVRDRVLAALHHLRVLDQLGSSPPRLGLALIREALQDSLENLEGTKGEYLTGGVTISALQPFRPVPFRILYLLGLGEDLFPGANVLPTFDLRSHERCPGDIRPAEHNRNLFLEALLAARDKIYLLYPNRDVQRDQELHPGTPVVQLRRFLEQQVIDGEFQVAQIPLSGCDEQYLGLENKTCSPHAPREDRVTRSVTPTLSDVWVNYNDQEKLLALTEARQRGAVTLGPRLEAEVKRRLQEAKKDFHVPPATAEVAMSQIPTITITELRRFLLCPAEAALRRHLGLTDEEDQEADDDEPFVSDNLSAATLISRGVEGFVRHAVDGTLADAVADWQRRFAELYEEWRLSCRVPEGAFAAVDQAALERELSERLLGHGGLAVFLKKRQKVPFVGPILLGESLLPVNARVHFPALTLPFTEEGPSLFPSGSARLTGAFPLAWRTDDQFELLVVNPGRSQIPTRDLSKPMLAPLLFFLALRAGTQAGPRGISSGDWLGDRTLRLHIAHAEGLASFTYRPGDLPVDKARKYLLDLTRDFLDTAFDLLPFELVVKDKELKKAFTERKAKALQHVEGYAERLAEAVALDQESAYPKFRASALLDLIEARIPANAFAKLRRRFRLLDRGPARNRTHQERTKRGAHARSGPTRRS